MPAYFNRIRLPIFVDKPEAQKFLVRAFYFLLAAMLAYTLIAQCILTHAEGRSLVNTFSYFTIQSNLLVLVSSLMLAVKPNRVGTTWRILRLAALAGISTTGFIYVLFLAKYVHLTGIAMVYNEIFHYVTPIVTVIAFLLIEPKHNFKWRDFWFMAWPIAWLIYTMLRAAFFHPLFTGFTAVPSNYPYEFLDISRVPLSEFIFSILFITAVLSCAGAAAISYDRRVKRETPSIR